MEGRKIVPSSSWSPTSWEGKPVAQQILYEDQEHLSAVTSRLEELPDLVPAHEIDQLSEMMTHAARGEVFVIQGGDCAEAFRDVQPEIVNSKRRLIVDQARSLSEGMGVPVVAIGRIAGQYSKPRSNCFEALSCGDVVSAVWFICQNYRRHKTVSRLTLSSSSVETTSTEPTRPRDHQILSVSAWAII